MSFLHLLSLLVRMPADLRPAFLLFENVVGFDTADTCEVYRSTMRECDYVVEEFLLDAKACVPNARKRWYGLASEIPPSC
jgi:site-specific DNA-cytosine methylase